MSKLEGKVAVISGGTTGIGLAMGRRFVTEGATSRHFGSRGPTPQRGSHADQYRAQDKADREQAIKQQVARRVRLSPGRQVRGYGEERR